MNATEFPNMEERPLQIKPLKIVLQTNIKGAETTDVVFSMFANKLIPDKSEYKYPYFTDSVKYPQSIAQSKETCLEFFFNRGVFEKTLRDTMVNYVDSNLFYENPLLGDNNGIDTLTVQKTMTENGEHNMMLMLRCLFTISDTFGKVLSSSFRQQIRDEFNPEIFTFDIKSLFSGNAEESVVKLRGKEYLVGDVIWLNDIANHPIYRKFLEDYNGKLDERNSYISKARNNYHQRLKKLITDLFKYIMSSSDGKVSKLSNFVGQLSDKQIGEKQKKDIKYTSFISQIPKQITDTQNTISQITTNRFDKNTGSFNKFSTTEELQETVKMLNEVMDAFISVHTTIRTINEQNEGNVYINIKGDVWRDFTNIYLSMIAVKSAKIVLDFVEGRIQKFDLKEKYNDGSPKQGEELDIIRDIKERYSQYVAMSESIVKSIQQITEPVRISINMDLEKAIAELKDATSKNINEPNKFRDIYLKIYKEGKDKKLYPEVMYTGVNIVSTNKDTFNEVYVYMNLVDKTKYNATKLKCSLKNEMAANNLLDIMNRKHTYLVNPYRLYGDFEAAKPPNLPVQPNKPSQSSTAKNNQKGKGMKIKTMRRRRYTH